MSVWVWRGTFFWSSFWNIFFTQKSHIWSKITQQVTNLKVFRETFLEKMQKLKSAFGLHIRGRIACEPIPKSIQCDPKIMEKTKMCKTHDFLLKIREKSKNLSQKGAQMSDFISGVAPLWAPLAPQSVFWTKNASKRLQKWPQGAQFEPKSDAKVLKMHPKLSKSKP